MQKQSGGRALFFSPLQPPGIGREPAPLSPRVESRGAFGEKLRKWQNSLFRNFLLDWDQKRVESAAVTRCKAGTGLTFASGKSGDENVPKD